MQLLTSGYIYGWLAVISCVLTVLPWGLALACPGLDARILLLGLLGYLLSVFCWYKTLHKLALSKAYALLSMSYVLV